MADDVVTIDLGNGSFVDGSGEKATYTGSITVDYTTATVSGNFRIEGYDGNGFGDSGNFNDRPLVQNGDRYTASGQGLTVIYTGQTPSMARVEFVANGNDTYDTLNNPVGQRRPPVTSNVESGTVCFASGTRIRVSEDGSVGEVVVEDLRVGSLCVTSSGAESAVRWLGHRTLDCRKGTRTWQMRPVRITANAFGQGCPSRDLRVSPGHGICVDVVGEVLIPAAALVNGTTIVQEEVDSVTYWHVELDCHEILLAENLPCESYLEMGNRDFFAESDVTSLHAGPDALAATHDDFCRPFHVEGPVVAFVRERLTAQAPRLGWRLAELPFANLALEVDGRRLEATVFGLSARFLVPAGAEEIWLLSDTTVPAEVGIAADLRALGVCVGSLVTDDGFGAPRTMAADHPDLCVGFYAREEGPQRWTSGRARLPRDLWKGCRGSFFLRIDLTRPALPRWVAPREEEAQDTMAAPFLDSHA